MLKLEKERNAGAKQLINLQNRIANNHVGADGPVRPNSRGITLVALVITIIVMLILVGVTIKVAIDGGLIGTAKEAAKGTEIQADRETLLERALASLDTVSSKIKTAQDLKNNLPNGWEVTGADGGPYTATSPNENKFIVDEDGNIRIPIELPEGWTEVAKPAEWDNERIIAVTDGTNTIPLPDEYEISNDPEENTIEKGVVITDEANEFVWIPVSEDFVNPYNYRSSYSEPTELESTCSSSTLDPKPAYDSQEILTELYGTKEDGSTPYYNYATDFAYSTHYAEMVESVNKYNGFYIGRFETTIDENNQIGSVGNTTVLTANKTIPQTNNKVCRWYGLYYVQRNSNVAGNNDYIQTNMIWGQQWDKMLEYFDSKSLDYDPFGKTSQGAVVNSGQSTNSSGAKDEIYNIYDLRTNGMEWTAEAYSTSHRPRRGGYYSHSNSALSRELIGPIYSDRYCSSRLTLYIR